MGIYDREAGDQFTLEDLGVLDSKPDPTFDAILHLTGGGLPHAQLAFLVADEARGSILVRCSASGWVARRGVPTLPLVGSLTDYVLHVNRTITDKDLGPCMASLPEVRFYDAPRVIAAPVHGPAGEPIGALAAFAACPALADGTERAQITQGAYLLSQRIMLRAALETVKRMSGRQQSRLQSFSSVRH